MGFAPLNPSYLLETKMSQGAIDATAANAAQFFLGSPQEVEKCDAAELRELREDALFVLGKLADEFIYRDELVIPLA